MDRVPLVDHPGSEVALHHGLRRQCVPEAPLDLRVCGSEQLIQAIGLLVVDIRPECECRNVPGHVVPAGQLLVDCFDLRLTPVLFGHLFHPWKLSADEPDHPTVVHSRHHGPCFIIPNRVEHRKPEVWIFRIRDKLSFRVHSVPTIQNMKSKKASRHDRVKVQRLAHIIMSLD